jgi:hypothetical protein
MKISDRTWYQTEKSRWSLISRPPTPSLKLQDTWLRTQDNYTFDVLKRDTNGCPCCTHRSTMGFGTEIDEANSTNAQRRADAATAGETAFEGVSAEKGCFCYSIDCHGAPDGKGCYQCEELSRKGTKQDVIVDCRCYRCLFVRRREMRGWRY